MAHAVPVAMLALMFVGGVSALDLPLDLHALTESVPHTGPVDTGLGEDRSPPPDEGLGPGLGERLQGAFATEMLVASIIGTVGAIAGLVGFAFVTRYISPKEALKNPQRAMLYGFVKATPGAHLKQLSDEFGMKTSSILWHVRKLEAAELVRSERSNGFRVFYPVQGGVEVKNLSRAVTALQNGNAQHLFAALERTPGMTVRELSERLNIHTGTIRWHTRKLRDFGLLDELIREDGSSFFPTPTGTKALAAVMGTPTERPRPKATAADA